MSCSECHATMRDRYFALNERPICAKCWPAFAARIERGRGPGAFQRAFLHGLVVALIGAAVLGTLVLFIPFVRIVVVIGVGHFVGKRIMAAVGGYSDRRYQWLAVGLTYFAIGLGSLVPAIKAASELADQHRAMAAEMQRKATAEELDAFTAEQAGAEAAVASTDGQGGAEGSAAAEEAPAPPERAPRQRPNSFRLGDLLGSLVLLPLVAMLPFGLTAAAVGLLTFIYALREAWRQTDAQGLVLDLRGPFRVDTGPIPPAN
jgi:hypothetical protein